MVHLHPDSRHTQIAMTWTFQLLLTWRLFRHGIYKSNSKQAWSTRHSTSSYASSYAVCTKCHQTAFIAAETCLVQTFCMSLWVLCCTSSHAMAVDGCVHLESAFIICVNLYGVDALTMPYVMHSHAAGVQYCKHEMQTAPVLSRQCSFGDVFRHCHMLSQECIHLLVCCCSTLGCVQC